MIKTEQLIENKEMRNKVIERVEVLDKVKNLLLIPDMEVMTTKMIADYYEVSIKTIQSVYDRNKKEIDDDGTKIIKSSKEFWGLQNESPKVSTRRGGATVNYSNGLILDIPVTNIRVFTKRCCLRYGMLLRDSVIAKEVRTQLLNVFETTTDEQRSIHIDEETMLYMNAMKAYQAENMESYFKATMEVNAYTNRNTARLEAAVSVLETENEMLAKGIAKWGDREICNKIIRYMSNTCKNDSKKSFYGVWWNVAYNRLLYKYGINVKARDKKKSQSLLDTVRDDEMPKVVKIVTSLAKEYDVNLTKVINSVNAENVESEAN